MPWDDACSLWAVLSGGTGVGDGLAFNCLRWGQVQQVTQSCLVKPHLFPGPDSGPVAAPQAIWEPIWLMRFRIWCLRRAKKSRKVGGGQC